MKKKLSLFLAVLQLVFILSSCGVSKNTISYTEDGHPVYETVNGNVPEFSSGEITDTSFESYSELDKFGRCGVAFACVGRDIMPTEDRESIGQVKPSGWKLVKYDIVDGKYLYNRCHLIGYQLTGENANTKNLITGTRFMNVSGMLPFENEVADYVESTGNHVMYRVTPVFEGDNLVASGVKMEAYSVEDKGKGVSFNVYVYNTQPGVEIDYKDGTSRLVLKNVTEESSEESIEESYEVTEGEKADYILNTNTMRIHCPDCQSAKDTKPQNRQEFYGTKEELLDKGYTPCGRCKP